MKVEGRRRSSHVNLGRHGAAEQHLKTNQEQAVITQVQREAKTTPNLQVFFFPLYRKPVINVRPGMSIGPQGLVSGSITPCLILSVMISVTALGKEFP